MATTYTVKKGDTLTSISKRYNTTVDALVKLNDITNPDYIVIGQVLQIDGTSTVKPNVTYQATIKAFGVMTGTANRLYATWKWDQSNTENYEILWEYDTTDGVWFVGSRSTTTEKQCTYDIPDNAVRVRFKVKPVAKKRKVNNKETPYWKASWSTAKIHSCRNNPPSVPPIPNVSLKDNKLTITLDNLNVNASQIEFQIIKDNSTVYGSGKSSIKYSAASYMQVVSYGGEYKVRCRAVEDKETSDWSNYSNSVTTKPDAPAKGITTCKANSETSVYLEWGADKVATIYDIEYTTKKTYFDGSNQTTVVNNIETTRYELTGLASGEQYFFRVRAVNDQGHSAWTDIVSVTIGKDPAAPTTWSSTTTAVSGEPLILYWAHNAEDGSSQTFAELEVITDSETVTHTIQNSTDEEEKDKVSFFEIDTTEYTEGTIIQWRVRTAGITKKLGDWSIQRKVDVYAQPTLELSVTSDVGEWLSTLTAFPFFIKALASPKTQAPIGYHVSVISNEMYETEDNIGNARIVNQGEEVYSKYFDINDALMIEMSAGNIDLENNIEYTIRVTVSMDSGLTATAESTFDVAWEDLEYQPNAEVSIDYDTLTANIRPYCQDMDGNPIEDITLSVYRREFDGSFTELATGLDNSVGAFITDPHPALDLARYRVVAIANSTGSVSFCDIPGIPVGESAVVIQWDEAWTNFETSNEDALVQPAWSGSMLKLPYNIDISDSYSTDVALVNYIGRKRPVSYYGTHLGETSTWNVVIPKEDVETLYALRRLAIWMSDVYVREPSGSGYWARITVSFSQRHDDLTIPITINVTRVEGGM